MAIWAGLGIQFGDYKYFYYIANKKNMKQCPRCKLEKPLSEFPIVNSKTGKTIYCGTCKKEYDREYWNKVKELKRESKLKTQRINRERNRLYIINILKTSICASCGISDWRVLEFHHKNADLKTFNLADCGSYSLNTIQEEVEKCEVLCANCHRIRTIIDRNYYNYENGL